MAHFLPPEHVRQVNKLEWPNMESTPKDLDLIKNLGIIRRRREAHDKVPLQHHMHEVHNLSLIKKCSHDIYTKIAYSYTQSWTGVHPPQLSGPFHIQAWSIGHYTGNICLARAFHKKIWRKNIDENPNNNSSQIFCENILVSFSKGVQPFRMLISYCVPYR